ncbi:MAG: hypothetical protein EOP53_14015, partial [Sphingobacteriales bacterium]
MDRNTITGIVLIALILITSTFFLKNTPEAEKNAVTTLQTDSLANKNAAVVTAQDSTVNAVSDSARNAGLPAGWANFTSGENKSVTLENEDVKINISSKGGKVNRVELKKYKAYNGDPVILVKEDANKFGFNFAAGNTTVNTENLYFTPTGVSAKAVTMVLNLPDGKSIQQIYKLADEGYLLDYDLNLNGLGDVIPRRDMFLDLNWESSIIKNEQDSTIASHNTTIHWRKTDESHDFLSETKDDEKKFKENTQWVSFKQQFFCQALITKQPFVNVDIASKASTNSRFLKDMRAGLTLPYDHKPVQNYDMQFYFGPLHYKTLGKLNLDLERQIPLGWSFFLTSWVNRFIIIPVFNFFGQFIGNYGIIILVLTLFI